MDFPDSSLKILQSIDTTTLQKDKDKAYYHLFLTMALDKTHNNPKNINGIYNSVKIFHDNKDIINEMISIYYYGRVLYLDENYSEALIQFFKAKDLAEKNKDFFYQGLANRGISDTFTQLTNYSEELYYAQKEFENFQQSDIQPYINYAILDLSTSLYNNWKIDESLNLLKQVKDSALKYEDKFLEYASMSLMAKNLMWKNEFSYAEPILLKNINSPFANTEDSLYYSWCLVELNNLDESERILKKISHTKKPFDNLIRHKIYRKKGNIEMALSEMVEMFDRSDDLTRERNKINLSSYLAEYFELNKKIDEIELQKQKLKFWLIILLFTIGLCASSIIFIYKRKRFKIELDNKLIMIDELKDSLEKNKFYNSKSSQLIDYLFKTQHKLISEIGEIYRFNPQTGKAKKKIDEKINSLISDFSIDGKFIESMENQVNKIYDNLFADFRSDLPSLKEIDYALFLYSIYGFSISAITIFIKESRIESIYNRKRRLKDKINTLSTIKAERYLSFL